MKMNYNYKNIFKIITVILILVCVFSLSACRSKTPQGNPDNTQATGQTPAPTPTGFNLDDEDDLTVTATPSGTSSATNQPSSTQGATVTPTPTLAPGQTPAPPVQTPVNQPEQSATPTPFLNTDIELPFDPFY